MAWFETGPPEADVDAVLDALRLLARDPYIGTRVAGVRGQVFDFRVPGAAWTIRYLTAREYHSLNVIDIY